MTDRTMEDLNQDEAADLLKEEDNGSIFYRPTLAQVSKFLDYLPIKNLSVQGRNVELCVEKIPSAYRSATIGVFISDDIKRTQAS